MEKVPRGNRGPFLGIRTGTPPKRRDVGVENEKNTQERQVRYVPKERQITHAT